MKRKTKKRSKVQRQTPADPATQYARDVIDGRIVTGPYVRLACKRHLADLERPDLVWKPGNEDEPGTANFVIGFFRKVLRLNGGQFEGLEFELQPWQKFIIGSLFGWKLLNGTRRFQNAYIEVGKSNGKTPLAGGIGCYMLTADNEARAEVYAAATKKDQAMILFRDAVAMRDQSPHLSARLTKSGIGEKCWNLADHETGSWFRPISSDDDSQSGPRPHCALIDELHEHKTDVVVNMMRAGFKWRRQPLEFEITNSGFDRHSVCFRHHEYSIKILDGVLTNDRWFAYVCGLDEGDDWRDETIWIKSNPNLNVSVNLDYLRDRVREAQAMPAVENIVRRLNFCEWTEQSERAIQMEVWDQGAAPINVEALRNRPCFGGLDLARVNDLSAFVLLFPPREDEETWKVLPFFWVPQDDILVRSRRDRVGYDVWVRQGFIAATPGNTTDYAFIEAAIVQLASIYQIQSIAFDRTFAGEIVQHLQEELGHDRLIQFGQGFLSMAAPTAELLRLFKGGELQHGGQPVLRWNASNLALASDPAGNQKPDKTKSTEKIDGISALVMALGIAQRNVGPAKSIYEERGVLRV
jgi:phage terminase large subunit-like protein